MTWIEHPLILQGTKVVLLPLEEKHFAGLLEATNIESIWTYLPVPAKDKDALLLALGEAIAGRVAGTQYPFVVVDKATKKIIGSTRFLKLHQEFRNLEIGWTWYLPEYWGTGINDECKLLMLTYCFEVLNTVKVQIVANDKNMRSRKAIERIGGRFEGVLRNQVIRYDGKRSSAYYSIIDEEWQDVKLNLEHLVISKNARLYVLLIVCIAQFLTIDREYALYSR